MPSGSEHATPDLQEIFDRPVDRSTSDPLLSVRGLTVTFGGVAALQDLSLDVGATDVIAVVGPNGAGKSTLLNAISRVVHSTGSMRYHGVELSRVHPARVASHGIGRSFQDAPLLDRETVLENVMSGAHGRLHYHMLDQVIRRRRVCAEESAMQRRALALLDFVGLVDQANLPAGELSFGARKLIDLVRAMVTGPQLLLLDEPSSGLDTQERRALQEILVALRGESRVAIVAVEHHMDLVRATATHVFALQAGRALMHGTPTEVFESPTFREAIVGSGRNGQQEPVSESLL